MKNLTAVLGKIGIIHVSAKSGADLSNFETNFDRYGSMLAGKSNVIFLYGRANKFIMNLRRPLVNFRKWRKKLTSYHTNHVHALWFKRSWDEDYGESYGDMILIHSDLKKAALKEHIDYEYHQSCSCSYDCCAHWFGGAVLYKTKSLGFGFYVIYTGYGMNV